MILKEIISKSYYGSVGYIENQAGLDLLEQYIVYNLPVLNEFSNIVTSTTYVDDNPELRIGVENTWKKYFPSSIHIDTGISRGHNFGAADNDNAIIDYCKSNNIDWVCKSANDIIFDSTILDIEIDEADFYYMNGMGFAGVLNNNSDLLKDVFYPQTNFYFINVSKIDYLNNKQYLDDTFKATQDIPNFSGRIWEYIDGWSCESFLKQCTKRNNLSKCHLISNKNYITLLKTIEHYKIQDSSHKNLMIEGICHFHFPQEEILIINDK
jgi:hypothetical protein